MVRAGVLNVQCAGSAARLNAPGRSVISIQCPFFRLFLLLFQAGFFSLFHGFHNEWADRSASAVKELKAVDPYLFGNRSGYPVDCGQWF